MAQHIHITTQRVQVENYTVYYKVVGEGTPLILVHGLSGSTLWWRRNVQALAEHYRVYLIDLPGFGAMSRRRGHFALKQAGQWLLQWMKAIGLSQADWIGHSMGGYICMWIAANVPEVVSRLILVSPAVLPPEQTFGRSIKPLLLSARYAQPRFFPILAYDALRTGFLPLLRAAREILAQDLIDSTHITAPTLLIWGEHDTLVPPELGLALQTKLPHAQLLILPRAGHVGMFDQAETFNRATLAFLQESKETKDS